jgi:hypothetical protein
MIAALLALLISTAFAQDVHHHAGASQAVDEFYSTWFRPDYPSASCCDKMDCYATAARMRNGHWQARQRETGNWIDVPDKVVEHNREGPDAAAHVCMQASQEAPYVYCFIAAGGT